MTNESILLERLNHWIDEAFRENEWSDLMDIRYYIEAQSAEIERLKLDVEAQEALHVSAYKAGVQFGWNCGFTNATDRYHEAMQGTEHIEELKRIREARAALEPKP